MDAILVVNAGSSSLKFQVFGISGGGLERRVRGQMDGIGVRPRLKAADAAGAVLVDRRLEAAEVGDLPAAIARAREWLRTLEGSGSAPSATASSTAARSSTTLS
jgi:acetate kinase